MTLTHLTISILLVLSFGSVQQQPTLSETLSWLKEKLTAYANTTVQIPLKDGKAPPMVDAKSFVAKAFGSCTVTWRITSELRVPTIRAQRPQTNEVTVNLGELDSSGTKVESHVLYPGQRWTLTLKGLESKKPFRYREISIVRGEESQGPIQTWPRSEIYFNDEEMAGRVAKAFDRAITLCGTEKEPF